MPTVHIYWLCLPKTVRQIEVERYLSILSADEVQRYCQYQHPNKRLEFLTGRVLAKTVLARALNQNPSAIQFQAHSKGKLYLFESISPNLFFNISHSRSVIACAISNEEEIGVDVACHSSKNLRVMTRTFVQTEMDWVISQPTAFQRQQAFCEIWTRKEAVMKMLGVGFALAPKSFSVPFGHQTNSDDQFDYYTFFPKSGYVLSAVAPRSQHRDFCTHPIRFSELFGFEPTVKDDLVNSNDGQLLL